MSGREKSTPGIQIELDGKLRRLDLSPGATDGAWLATLDGDPIEIDARLIQPGVLSLIVQGDSFRCVLDEGPLETAIQTGGQRILVLIEDPRSLTTQRRKAGASSGQQVIKAPMPGRIVRLLVQPGDGGRRAPRRRCHRSDEDAERTEGPADWKSRGDQDRSRRDRSRGRSSIADRVSPHQALMQILLMLDGGRRRVRLRRLG